MMKCPMREYKTVRFLFWSFNVMQDHEWEVLMVGVHIPDISDNFKVHAKCKHCGKKQVWHFIEHEKLLEMGYTPNQIEEFRRTQA